MGLKVLAFTTSLLVACIAFLSCSKQGEGEAGTSYQGPGSVWGATLNDDGTFVITRKDSFEDPVDLTVNGTYTTLASGFILLTVSSSTGSDGPDAGDKAYALNVPGMVLLVKPLGGDGEIIPMVATGTCPTSNISANWVQVNKPNGADFSDADQDLFGTFTFNTTTLLADLPKKFSLERKDLSGTGGGIDNSEGNACSAGVLTVGTDDNGGSLWLTTSGAAIVSPSNGGEHNGAIIAMPAEEVTQANLDGTYAGLVFTDNDDGTFPVQLEIENNGTTGAGAQFDDIEANDVSSTDSATFAFSTANQVVTTNNGTVSAPGFMTGTINGAKKIACMALEDANSSGKNILFCVGQSPGDATEMFSLMAVQVN